MAEAVVVGNGVSGWACAKRLAELGVDVTMIGPGRPHDRPPLSKRALMSGNVPYLADDAKMTELGVRHLDGLVVDADLESRRLTVAPSDGGETVRLDAPKLIWATGFRYPSPPVSGIEAVDVHGNATADAMLRLYRTLQDGPRRVAVIGAGLIGTETAATLADAGHTVTLLDMLDRPLARLHPLVSDAARQTLERLGVAFLGGCRIESIADAGSGARITTATHGEIACDTLVTAAGFRTSLPAALAPDGRALGVDVDETLAVIGQTDVWACGDVAQFPHPRWGRIAIPHWDHALHSGRHVAEAIAGSTDPYVRDPYYFSDIGPLRVQQVGFADAVDGWSDDDGFVIGRDGSGRIVAILFMNAPARLGEARARLAAGE